LRRTARLLVYQRDEELFFKDQLQIQTKAMTKIRFQPNPVQLPLMKLVREQKKTIGKIRLIIFKCRQPGISTWSAGLVAHKYLLNDNVYAFTIAQDKSTVANIFKMHEIFYTGMDEDIRPVQLYHTKGTETVVGDVSTQSRLLVGEAKNINVGTGMTIHVVHASECCRYPYPQQITDSLIPALSDAPGTVRIFESTAFPAPGGVWFKSMCERAMRGETEYKFHFVEWWRMPEYQIPLSKGEKLKLTEEEKTLTRRHGLAMENIKWRRMKIADLDGDVETFRQSYPITFDEGWQIKGSTAFARERLMEMREFIRPPIKTFSVFQDRLIEDPEGELSVWFEPEPGKTYDIGADVGGGSDIGDASTVEVVERYSLRQVAEWRGFIDPVDFAYTLATIGRYYNNAQVAPEVEKFGMGTLGRLQQIYTNIFVWRKRDTIVPEFTHQLGWATNHTSKLMIVAFARHSIWHRKVQVYSLALWEELMHYSHDVTPSGMHTYNAAPGETDDIVMAWLIALQTSDDENILKWTEQKIELQQSRKNEIAEEAYRAQPLTAVSLRELSEEIGDWK